MTSVITLKNDFHGTSRKVKVVNNLISNDYAKRIKNDLCGISDCQCSNGLGVRGKQVVEIDQSISGWYITK